MEYVINRHYLVDSLMSDILVVLVYSLRVLSAFYAPPCHVKVVLEPSKYAETF